MKIQHKLIQKLAELSSLTLSKEETAMISKNLNAVLESMEILQSLPVSEKNCEESCLELADLRTDETASPLPREIILKNAPQTDGSYFVIPKTLK